MVQSVIPMNSDAIIGPAMNTTNPIVTGSANNQPQTAWLRRSPLALRRVVVSVSVIVSFLTIVQQPHPCDGDWTAVSFGVDVGALHQRIHSRRHGLAGLLDVGLLRGEGCQIPCDRCSEERR